MHLSRACVYAAFWTPTAGVSAFSQVSVRLADKPAELLHAGGRLRLPLGVQHTVVPGPRTTREAPAVWAYRYAAVLLCAPEMLVSGV